MALQISGMADELKIFHQQRQFLALVRQELHCNLHGWVAIAVTVLVVPEFLTCTFFQAKVYTMPQATLYNYILQQNCQLK